MRVDLHNHTILCNHATGSVDEYALRAIELGIDVYGFSCHAPMNYDPKYRMKIDEMDLYEQWVKSAKTNFKDEIDILLAYEIDYIDGYVLDEVLNRKVDYFISSIHFLKNKNDLWGFDNPEFIGVYKNKDIDTIWQEYFDAIEQMAKCGKFDVVGHLDLIKVFKFLPKKDIRYIANGAIKAIKKSDMVLELNSAGLRKPINEIYPSFELLELCFENDIKITFSSDAHSVEQVGLGYETALKCAKDIGFKTAYYFKNRDKIAFNI